MNITVTQIRSIIAAYETAVQATAAADAAYYGPIGTHTREEWDENRDAIEAARIRRHEEWLAAREAQEAARTRIKDLVISAEWGPQDNGRVFVTCRSGWDSNFYVTINVDGLTVVSGEIRQDYLSGDHEVVSLRLHDVAAERADRERRRAASRAVEIDQAEIRARIADDLRRGRVPRGVEAVDGQRGGYLVIGARTREVWLGAGAWWSRETTPGKALAIRGVLKAAGIEPGDHPYATWKETIADLTSREPEVRVRARQLPPRVRHMRADEARS